MPLCLLSAVLCSFAGPLVTFDGLLREMTDPTEIARFPNPTYESLLATSYNRESVKRGQPGWFADSDGTGFIRQDGAEWVIMEHQGPGCITKVWTPFFYYDFNERTGPNVRIYLDGAKTPVIDESLIKLVCGQGTVPGPFAAYTARAGNLYLPIPFAKSAKVTMTAKPFYNSVAYRAYPAGTRVETFDPKWLQTKKKSLDRAASSLTSISIVAKPPIERGKSSQTFKGPGAIQELKIWLPEAQRDPSILRTAVLAITFDGEQTVWCPVGDFFCSPDSLHPFRTARRSVNAAGIMTCLWPMPYRKSAEVRLLNLGKEPLRAGWTIKAGPWKWDDRSMHFHANWRPDDIVPGTPFQDWNFVDIQGKGVYVGDAWTVLNIKRDSWWGEGDEKIYADGAWDKGFPTQFGTGSEDYYGWAGGVYPVAQDEFSQPFLANVKVGGLDGHTLGYNINTRERALDAIPFQSRLRFDMEASFGVDMRNPWNLLGYSCVTFWYSKPGAVHNRPASPTGAARPIMSLDQLQKQSDRIRGTTTR